MFVCSFCSIRANAAVCSFHLLRPTSQNCRHPSYPSESYRLAGTDFEIVICSCVLSWPAGPDAPRGANRGREDLDAGVRKRERRTSIEERPPVGSRFNTATCEESVS